MTEKHRSKKGVRGAPAPALSRRTLLGHAARAAALLAPGLAVVERASAAPGTPLLAAAGPRQAPVGTLRVALSDIGSERFDPRIDSAGSQLVWAEIFEPLIGVDADGKLDNSGLAPRWEISPDGKSITFHLAAARWHDGVEFTADDVKYNLDVYYRAPGTLSLAGGFIKANVISTTVRDKSTITVTLNSPVAPNLAQFGNAEGELYIVPKHYLETNGLDAMAKTPIGTGPLKFGRQQLGQWVEIDSNTDYRNPARIPRYKTARVSGIAEPATRVAALRTGQVDLAEVDPSDVPGLQLAGFTMKPLRYGALTVGFFLKAYDPSKIATHVEFRKALNLAIDRQAIFKAIYPPGTAEILHGSGLYTPGAIGDDQSLQPYPYQPDEARRLLTGLYHGEPVTIWSFSLGFDPEEFQVNDLIQGYWQKVGLNVTVQRIEYATFRPRTATQDYPGPAETAVFAPAPRPSMVSQILVFLAAISDGGTIDVAIDHQRAKAWYDELVQMKDPAMLQQRLREINRTMYQEYWNFPLFLKHIPFAYQKTVASWEPGAYHREYIRLWSAVPA